MTRLLLLADECAGCLAVVRGLPAAGHEPWVGVSRAQLACCRGCGSPAEPGRVLRGAGCQSPGD
jgi:hypothetical protein